MRPARLREDHGASRLRLVALLVTIAMAVGTLLTGTGPLLAQESERRQGLLNFLFGNPRIERREEQPRPRARTRRDEPKNRADRPSARKPAVKRAQSVARPPSIQEQPAIVKRDDAKVVLVIGDFIGGGLSEGLVTAFAESESVRVVTRTNGSSGLVRDDFFDWPNEIEAILETEKPAAVIIALGSNDRQPLVLAGNREAVLSPGWKGDYERRAAALAAAIKGRNLPFLWMGMPSFKSTSMTADMLALNDLYQNAATSAGGEFVDIWDGFVDENGKFVESGPDYSGQTARLRASDGINFTAAGKRKLAFYFEKSLNRILGDPSQPPAANPAEGLQLAPSTAVLPDISAIERTLPVSLADPELDGGAELLGGQPPASAKSIKSAADRLAIEGIAPEPAPGRADDYFRRPQPAPALPTLPDAEKTTAIRP